MMEWESYYSEATDYCNVARNAALKGKLGNTVIYNVASMAVENFMTSLLISENIYPEHSSISGMMREIKKIWTVPEEFINEVRFLNSFMNLCSLDVVPEKVPTDEEVRRMVGFVTSFKEWIRENLVSEDKKS